VTDAGDSAFIVGDTGIVVASGNPDFLAREVEKMISLDEREIQQLGKQARKRIIENFSLHAIVKRYETIYKETLHTFWQ
jgi:glycosyltransferase involved in cell wall biosynthesis